MAGSPKKRARREAAQAAEEGVGTSTSAPSSDPRPIPEAALIPAAPAPIDGEVLPPAPDVTKTQMRRAMRVEAEKYAEKALDVLAGAMDSDDERVRVSAANDILDRAFGKPKQELEVDGTGLVVNIIKFATGGAQ